MGQHLLPGEVLDQSDDLAGFCMASRLEFGIHQLPVHTDFVTASVGWYKRDAFYFRFEILE